MRKITLLMLLLVSSFGFSQIGVVQNFDSSTSLPTGWTQTGGVSFLAERACAGNSAVDNVYGSSSTGTLVTPNLVGGSNGTLTTVSFSYKILNYNTDVARPAGWGNIQVQYSTNNGTAWTTFYTINDANHVIANTCATVSTTIPAATLPNGSDVKFRFLQTWAAGDWNLYYDNISITQVSSVAPACAVLATPAPGATNVANTGTITWAAPNGIPTGYRLTVGTTPGGTNVLNNVDVANVNSYSLGALAYSTTYYVKIVPYNANGTATGCTESSFTTISAPPQGSTCADPLLIAALPFTTTDDTANFRDSFTGSPGATGCSSTNAYLSGNDVVYKYTAAATGSIKIVLTPTATYSGIFVYENCANIGVACLAGAANSGSGVRTIESFPVTAGVTYYFVVSTWTAPQTTAFTLAITENSCTNATVEYNVVSDCANGSQFKVNVNVTNMGSASTLLIKDNQSSADQIAIGTGNYTFGPYPNGTSVIFTVENEQDATCMLTSPARTQTACPPSNDQIANAATLTVSASSSCENAVSGTTVGATHSTEYTCSTTDVDVWYTFTPAATGVFNFGRTVSTGTGNGYISVYSGTPAALVRLNTSCSVTSLSQALTAGTQYYVSVSGSTTSTLAFALCVYQAPPPPANDDCANAELLVPSADTTCATQVLGTTISATQSLAGCAGTADDDVWYKFVATSTAHNILTANVSGAEDIVTQVFDSCGGASLVCQDTPNSPVSLVGLTIGNTYFFRIYTYTGTTTTRTTFNVCVTTAPAAPANDLIANAAVLTESPTSACANGLAGTTISATHSAEYACSTTDVDVWYTFTPATTGVYNFGRTVVSGTGNGYISVYSGTSAALVRLNTSCSVTSFSQALTAGTQYYVSVSSTSSSTLSFTLCVYPAPPAPANDNCATPTMLTPAGTYVAGAVVSSNISGTIETGMVAPTCGTLNTTNGRDVWFSVAAPASGTLTIETGTDTGSPLVDTVLQAYRGNCGALVAPTGWCNDDIASGTNIFSRVALTGLTAGEMILVRVFNYGTTASGTFKIAAYDASLSTATFDNASFKAYPNPVKDILTLSYSQDMSNVAVFNLVGQQVINKSLNATEANVDMSNLSAGTYLVKVTVDNQVKTIKVVKQ